MADLIINANEPNVDVAAAAAAIEKVLKAGESTRADQSTIQCALHTLGGMASLNSSPRVVSHGNTVQDNTRVVDQHA